MLVSRKGSRSKKNLFLNLIIKNKYTFQQKYANAFFDLVGHFKEIIPKIHTWLYPSMTFENTH